MRRRYVSESILTPNTDISPLTFLSSSSFPSPPPPPPCLPFLFSSFPSPYPPSPIPLFQIWMWMTSVSQRRVLPHSPGQDLVQQEPTREGMWGGWGQPRPLAAQDWCAGRCATRNTSVQRHQQMVSGLLTVGVIERVWYTTIASPLDAGFGL